MPVTLRQLLSRKRKKKARKPSTYGGEAKPAPEKPPRAASPVETSPTPSSHQAAPHSPELASAPVEDRSRSSRKGADPGSSSAARQASVGASPKPLDADKALRKVDALKQGQANDRMKQDDMTVDEESKKEEMARELLRRTILARINNVRARAAVQTVKNGDAKDAGMRSSGSPQAKRRESPKGDAQAVTSSTDGKSRTAVKQAEEATRPADGDGDKGVNFSSGTQFEETKPTPGGPKPRPFVRDKSVNDPAKMSRPLNKPAPDTPSLVVQRATSTPSMKAALTRALLFKRQETLASAPKDGAKPSVFALVAQALMSTAGSISKAAETAPRPEPVPEGGEEHKATDDADEDGGKALVRTSSGRMLPFTPITTPSGEVASPELAVQRSPSGRRLPFSPRQDGDAPARSSPQPAAPSPAPSAPARSTEVMNKPAPMVRRRSSAAVQGLSLEKLDELHKTGYVTDAEFTALRAALMEEMTA